MIQKSLIFVVLLFLFPLLLLSAENKTYKIGCNKNYYPYITTNEETGQLQGIVIDWWNLWAEKKDVNIEFVAMDLAACIEKTKSGEIDAIAGLFYSDERAKFLDITEQLIRMRTVLFLKKGIKADSIPSISDSIGVLKNDLAYFYVQEKYPEIKLKVFDDYRGLQTEVQNQRISGFIYDLPNPMKNYKKVKAPKGYYIFETLYSEKLRAAVKKGNRNMLNLIISGSASITDEELFEIADKWNFYQPNRLLLWILLISGIVLGLVLALFISKLFRDKRRIKEMEDYVAKTDWKLIIDKGENDQIEFKSSLRWDYRQEKPNKVLEKVITKTISAFLNTAGGMLFIGVDDEGKILGLEKDYNTLSKKNSDGFLLSLTNIINVQLGKSVHKFVHINIISINERDVCIISADKCDKPVFMGSNDKEEFYIRASASSQPLGVRETYKYINSQWK